MRTTCIGLAGWLAAAAGADVITVKPEVYVKGPAVYLGEIADIDGDNAESLARVEIVQAALPGDAKQFNASLVEARIRNIAGFEGEVTLRGADRVVARTLSQEVTPDSLVANLKEFIVAEMPWDAENATIDINAPTRSLVVPDGAVDVSWSTEPLYQWLGSSAFRGEIRVDGELKDTLNVRATIEAYREVVVSASDISRGTMIAPSHLAMQKQALSTLRDGAFTDPAEVVGQLARSTIFPGKVLTTRQVMPRRLIKRNQMVNVETRVGTLSVSARARALGDGHEGDLIPMAHPETKAEYYGVVQADGTVLVE